MQLNQLTRIAIRITIDITIITPEVIWSCDQVDDLQTFNRFNR